MRVSTHHDPSNGGPAADLLSRASSCNTTPVTSLIQPLCCRQDDVSFPRVHIHFNLPTCSWSSFLLAVSLWQILSFYLTACSNLTVQYCWGISLVAVTKYFFGGKFFWWQLPKISLAAFLAVTNYSTVSATNCVTGQRWWCALCYRYCDDQRSFS